MKAIIKRDGSKQEFLAYKITDAIKKAFTATNKEYDYKIFVNVVEIADVFYF